VEDYATSWFLRVWGATAWWPLEKMPVIRLMGLKCPDGLKREAVTWGTAPESMESGLSFMNIIKSQFKIYSLGTGDERLAVDYEVF